MTVNNAASWYHDPLPGDNSSQNHAVLVYGWRDTPGQESAGYFVARNTFIMEKNGCRELHIPFEYLEKYAVAAGSIRIPADDTAAKITEVPAAKEENTVMNQNISSGAASNFFDTIRSNIDNGMYFYPDFRMSFFHNFTKKVDSAGVLKSEKDVSGYYREFLADRGVTSSLDTTVKLFTFQISSSSKLLLAAAFFAPQKEGAAVADQDIRQLHNYIKMTAGSSVQHTFLVLGSEFNFDSSCNASTNPAVILCEYVKHDIWTHRIPDFHAGELSRRFLVHIMPGRYAGELKNIISMHDGLSGNINLAYLKRSLVYSGKLDDESIAFALDELFIHKEYAMDRNGNILLCKDHPQLPSGFTVASRFSRPIGIIRRIYYAWNIISLLLPLLVQTTARMMHIELPWLISFGLSGLSLLVARLSWMAKLRFNYNIK